jgi:hypothetical protein
MTEFVNGLRSAADKVAEMQADGVTLVPNGGTQDDYAHLVTSDAAVARKHGMQEKREEDWW